MLLLGFSHFLPLSSLAHPSPTSLRPRQNLSKTLFMLPPFSIEMTRVWSSSFTQIKKLFSLLCLGAGGKGMKRQDKNWGRSVCFSHTCTRETKTVDQPHTRFPEHLASLEPFLLQSTMGTQVYQTENGPENKGIRLKNSHRIVWASQSPSILSGPASPLILSQQQLP